MVGNADQSRVRDCMLALALHLSRRGLRVLAAAGAEPAFPSGAMVICAEEELANESDLLISIGGDGTLLRAAHLTAGRPIPLVGINHGRLGFLTDISPNSMLDDIDRILSGDFIEERRSLLEARIEEAEDVFAGKSIAQGFALNDVVVEGAGDGRILDFETSIGGRFVSAHRGNGLVIATSTGSTAYALSCGGPIVVPSLDVFVVTPVCPHTLSDRPLIVGANTQIEVRLAPRGSKARVYCDGQILVTLTAKEYLRVSKAAAHVKLLHPPDYDYFKLLRSKLRWGGGRTER